MVFQDPYCYPNTDTLINKLEIKEKERLERQEGYHVGLAMLDLFDNPIKGNFDYKHLQEIHKFLFKDIYEWAGQTRTVYMEKFYSEINGVRNFALPEYIEPSIQEVFKELIAENHLRDIQDVPAFANKLSYYMSEINAIHPFREGNGRTQREFIRCLSLKNGFELDWSKTDEKELTRARAMSVTDSKYLEMLIQECLTKLPVKEKNINKDLER